MIEANRRNVRLTLKTLLLILAVFGSSVPERGHAQGPASTGRLTQAERSVVASCKSVPADAEYFVPEHLSDHVVPSGSGAYGYRKGCPFWVVDFSLNQISNSELQPDGTRFIEETLFYGQPHDLPSSQTANGISPIVPEDCGRLRVEYYIFTKFKHEAQFVFQRHIFRVGNWTGQNKCLLTKDPLQAPDRFKLKAPTANVLVVRVATRVKLRTSWQEAAARIHDFAPQ